MMFLPISMEAASRIQIRDRSTGQQVWVDLRRPQRITPGFYMRRHDETGIWLEPISVAGETNDG